MIQLERHSHHANKFYLDRTSRAEEDAILQSDVTRKPHRALDAMSAQMKALQTDLMEIQKQNMVTLEHQEADYDRKLEQQAARNLGMKTSNKKLASQIEDLRVTNSNLRIAAEHVMGENANLKKELEEIKRNFSIAEEFAEQTLLSNNEIAILDELKQKELDISQKMAHERELNSINPEGAMIMLKLSSRSTHPEGTALNPQTLLQPLLSSFEQLASEQNASEVSLMESFEKAFREGEEQGSILAKDQEKLFATKARETQLNERLAAALAHVEKVHKQMSSHLSHLRLFAKHLGDQPVPDTRRMNTAKDENAMKIKSAAFPKKSS